MIPDPDILIILTLALVFGLFMAWGIGANDVANAMGTSVGSKTITLTQAIVIAAIFEFLGAFLAGGAVTSTVSRGLVDPTAFQAQPELLAYGMLAALLAAGSWLLFASHFGWPVSTTHSIIGAIVGFSAVGLGVHAVEWGKVAFISVSWVLSPLFGGLMAFTLFRSVQFLIFNKKDPFTQAQKMIPIYIFLASLLVFMITITKGFKNLGLNLTFNESLGVSIICSIIIAFIGRAFAKRIKAPSSENSAALSSGHDFSSVERVFGILMVFTACAMAFAHGSNDVANAVGPIAAILSAINNPHDLTAQSVVPWWVLLIGGTGIVLGLLMYGRRVMATVGAGITELTPSRGFAATLGAAATVVIASGIGMPVSTTHTLVGAVLGVGLARGIGAINLNVIRTIFASWLVTLPVGASLAIVYFYLFKWLLS